MNLIAMAFNLVAMALNFLEWLAQSTFNSINKVSQRDLLARTLLGAKRIATRSKDAIRGSGPYY